jgi:hypothetical protein
MQWVGLIPCLLLWRHRAGPVQFVVSFSLHEKCTPVFCITSLAGFRGGMLSIGTCTHPCCAIVSNRFRGIKCRHSLILITPEPVVVKGAEFAFDCMTVTDPQGLTATQAVHNLSVKAAVISKSSSSFRCHLIGLSCCTHSRSATAVAVSEQPHKAL